MIKRILLRADYFVINVIEQNLDSAVKDDITQKAKVLKEVYEAAYHSKNKKLA